MKVSVILTTKSWTRYDDFLAALRSVEGQTYEQVQLVCPIDHSRELATATAAITDGGTVAYVESDCMAAARNRGAELADGDVYAFIDDDCVAKPNWVAELVGGYEAGEIAVGGPAHPIWPGGKRPRRIPPAFDWLVGCGPYYDCKRPVRNTYGCNLSVRGDVFDALGGFDESLGKGTALDQGEEAELCTRMADKYGQMVQHRPNASVYHCVYDEQIQVLDLLKRAYNQGRCKAQVGVGDAERSFLSEIVGLLPTLHGPPTIVYAAAAATGYIGRVMAQ